MNHINLQNAEKALMITTFLTIIVAGYGLEILKGRTISSSEAVVLPVNADSLRFVKYRGNILEMSCYEFCNWSNSITLFLDCETLSVMER